ncbi:MAG TPA: glycosyltransferase family 87 protein [Candidatus Polarisedimenticolaceae bacterium]|nr:glycosyltransferase family 87 protein [Candidatus Polarisedimenticolaceae bacterium]
MRTWLAVALALAAAICGFTAGAGLTGSVTGAAAFAAVAAAFTGVLAYRHPPVVLDARAAGPGLKLLGGATSALALVQLARLAVFTVAPAHAGWSWMPWSDWEVRHSCLTAYYVAADAVDNQPNVYDDVLYSLPDTDPTGPRKPRMLGPFRVDVYEYPPPFLLLPQALMLVTPDFEHLRIVWFALNCSVVLAALLVVTRSLGPTLGTRALLLSPLALVAFPVVSMLQKGNVQAMVIGASMLAMVLFERRRDWAGGALLAFVTASKLYPGLLIVYLLARRQWRAVAWTAVFGVGFALVTLALLGWEPYAAFLDHLPGLLGGESFPAFRNPVARAINYSIPGLVFKLGLFGVPGMSFGAAKIVGWIYTLIALAVVYMLARHTLSTAEAPLVWLAIIILATLRSPFLPQGYGGFPALWLLTLLAASYPTTAKTLGLTLLAWIALNVYWPMDWPVEPRWLALASGVPQAMTIVLAVLGLRHRPAG